MTAVHQRGIGDSIGNRIGYEMNAISGALVEAEDRIVKKNMGARWPKAPAWIVSPVRGLSVIGWATYALFFIPLEVKLERHSAHRPGEATGRRAHPLNSPSNPSRCFIGSLKFGVYRRRPHGFGIAADANGGADVYLRDARIYGGGRQAMIGQRVSSRIGPTEV